jgi:hypothetical protein
LALAVYRAVSPNKRYEIFIRTSISELDMRDFAPEVPILSE